MYKRRTQERKLTCMEIVSIWIGLGSCMTMIFGSLTSIILLNQKGSQDWRNNLAWADQS